MEKVIRAEELAGNMLDPHIKTVADVVNLRIPDGYTREEAVMKLNLLPGKSKGY